MTSGDYPDDFELITALQNAKANAEDFERSQRALAGLETGDGSNHNHKAKDKNLLAQREKGIADQLTALQEALQNPAYAAAYGAFMEILEQAEALTATAIAEAKADLADMENGAGRLPGGVAVFKDANGNVFTADGKPVDPAVAAGVQWPDNAPSWEAYQQRRKELDDLHRYQVDVLGVARDRVTDPDTPMTKEELEGWQKRMENEAPDLAKPEADSSRAATSEIKESSLNVSSPELL